MISIRNLHKAYGEVKALKEVNLSVEAGELFGLIGPDGAGKTTLMRLLATLLLPDEGDIDINGLNAVSDYRKLRQQLGYMPGRFSLYYDLTVEENLKLFATIFGTSIEANYELIKDIYQQIEPFRKRRAGALSGGMKQKLALSCALIHAPRLLLLDEPTTGVDAVSRREFWDMLDRLKAQGITIFVSTPYMDEASRCDRVALIQDGVILQIDTPEAIEAAFTHELLAVKANEPYRLLKDLRAWEHAHSVQPFGEFIHLTDRRVTSYPQELRAYLELVGHESIEIQAVAPNIEDCFMALM